LPEEPGYLEWQDRRPGAVMVVAQHVLLLPRTWWGTIVHAVAAQAWIGVPMVLCEWYGHSQFGWGMFLVLPLLLAAFVVFLCGSVAAVKRNANRRVMVWGLVGLLAGFGLIRLRGVARTAVFAACAQRAQPLVDAITRFEKERGSPPARLEDLVPAYLPVVPGTGLPDFPRFDFGRAQKPRDGLEQEWELTIRCTWGFVSFDTFFYWPSQDYPQQIYGGWVERIGTWAYVHE
jgi:hypothetical protein